MSSEDKHGDDKCVMCEECPICDIEDQLPVEFRYHQKALRVGGHSVVVHSIMRNLMNEESDNECDEDEYDEECES